MVNRANDPDGAIKPNVAGLLDEALGMGIILKSENIIKTSVVEMIVPQNFPKALLEQLVSKPTKDQLRHLWRVRELSRWLSKEYQQWLHGESIIEGDEYGEWIDLFVSADRILRFAYPFEGCIWGVKGCNESSPIKYAPVLCGGCQEIFTGGQDDKETSHSKKKVRQH